MRHLGLLALLCTTACFNPGDADDSGTSADSSSSGTTASGPTSGSMTDATTQTPTTSTDTASSTTADATDTTDPTATDTTGSTAAESSSTGSNPACAGEEVCVESAPAGWDGPGLRITADSGPPPNCGMDYSIQGPGGFTGAMAPPANCECSCELPSGLECEAAYVVYYSDDKCNQGEGAADVDAGQCDPFYIGQGNNSVTAQGVAPTGVECEPSLDITIPPVGPTDPTSLCLPESFGSSCGDGSTCLPSAEVSTYCISQMGDVPCPADSAYDTRTVLYGDFEDTRGCGDCSCGGPDIECGGAVRAYSNNNCGGGFVTVAIDGSCVGPIDDSFGNARYFPTPATGGCPTGGGASEGDVTPLMPTTLCCADF